MKRIALVLLAGLALTGCDSIRQKVGEEVRQVEIGDSLVSDGWNTVVYHQESDVAGLDFDENEPELSVNLIDVETGTSFKVPVGSECNSWPAPKGSRFLVRFDRSASKAKPKDIYISPQSNQVANYICG